MDIPLATQKFLPFLEKVCFRFLLELCEGFWIFFLGSDFFFWMKKSSDLFTNSSRDIFRNSVGKFLRNVFKDSSLNYFRHSLTDSFKQIVHSDYFFRDCFGDFSMNCIRNFTCYCSEISQRFILENPSAIHWEILREISTEVSRKIYLEFHPWISLANRFL